MIAHLVYYRYYDFDSNQPTLGGVQTYIQGLCPVLINLGYSVNIYQCGDKNSHLKADDNIEIFQYNTSKKKYRDDKIRIVVDNLMKAYEDSTDILIFMANELTVKTNASRTIAIQHGISWDALSPYHRSKLIDRVGFFLKSQRAYKIINRLNDVKHIVCVDHNFPNWLRATAARFSVPMTVIPNFTEIPPQNFKPKDCINIIFARRLFDYRGARLFAEVMATILPRYRHVHLTIAGTGPEEPYMKECLKSVSSQVTYTQYRADETLAMHADKHIAVVPTLNSEGTSLSLLEAMAANCAVVATDIGGISNIIIDGYNGLFSTPGHQSLADSISFLIEHDHERNRMAENAYLTAKHGFSKEVWCQKWRNIIHQLS